MTKTSKSASLALRTGQISWKGLETIQVAADSAGSVSFAVDSVPLPPYFRFSDVAARVSTVHSVIAIQKSLLASMVVQAGRARKPLETTSGWTP